MGDVRNMIDTGGITTVGQVHEGTEVFRVRKLPVSARGSHTGGAPWTHGPGSGMKEGEA